MDNAHQVGKKTFVFLLCGQGRTQRGVGVNPPPLSLIFKNTLLPAQRRLIVFAHFLFVNLSTKCKYHGMNLHAYFKDTLQMGQKEIIRFWWECGLSSASRNHLNTFCRPFVHYARLRLCSVVVHFIRNNCLCFVYYG